MSESVTLLLYDSLHFGSIFLLRLSVTIQGRFISVLALSLQVSNADEISKSMFSQNVHNSNLYRHICIQHEECIQMSTNKPSIGSVALEIALWFLKIL